MFCKFIPIWLTLISSKLGISSLSSNYFRIIVLDVIKSLIDIETRVFMISVSISLIPDSVFSSQDIVSPFPFSLNEGDLICLPSVKWILFVVLGAGIDSLIMSSSIFILSFLLELYFKRTSTPPTSCLLDLDSFFCSPAGSGTLRCGFYHILLWRLLMVDIFFSLLNLSLFIFAFLLSSPVPFGCLWPCFSCSCVVDVTSSTVLRLISWYWKSSRSCLFSSRLLSFLQL